MLFELNEIKNVPLARNEITKIDTINARDVIYSDFFENYIVKNAPCLIKGAIDSWESSKIWHENGKINFKILEEKYGTKTVTVYNCLKKYYNSQETYNTTFGDYLNYFRQYKGQSSKLDYLKNWHLQLNSDCDFYEVPLIFASDWLNEYYINAVKEDDYRFVYMGPENTWTPFHVDVFSSYSWSSNVCGRKKWIFLPPGEELLLKDNLGNLPYDIYEQNLQDLKRFEVIQETGETIFVPSGWHHQVHNLEDTISINHNWINGCNIKLMFDNLKLNLNCVKKEIEDCSDMDNYEEHCQLMLNAAFGIDFYKFYEFLKYIALNRIDIINRKISNKLFHNHKIGDKHCIFDLYKLNEVLELFLSSKEVKCLEYFNTTDVKPCELLKKIKNILNE